MKHKPRTIEERIRAIALSKIKVRITGRTRSKTGFEVVAPTFEETEFNGGQFKVVIRRINIHFKSKQEALQNMLARVRCMSQIQITIKAKQ